MSMESTADIAAELLADTEIKTPRKRAADRKVYGKSKISNGHGLLPDIDGRTLLARRYRNITQALVIDQGGSEQISEVRLQLVRRFSAAACLAEQMESKLAAGEDIDVQQHALLSSTMVRVANKIGIDRVPKDVTTVDDYLDMKAGE